MNLKKSARLAALLSLLCLDAPLFAETSDALIEAARYGKDFMKFNIEWYQKLLDETRGNKI